MRESPYATRKDNTIERDPTDVRQKDGGCETARWSESQKASLSTDCTLQLECMKSESLVIADQQAAVNTFPGLVHAARHTMGVGA